MRHLILNRLIHLRSLIGRARHYSTNDVHQNSFYDVVISGGGMVGAAMLSALGHTPELCGKRIVMLEGGADKQMLDLPSSHSSRTVALSQGTVNLFTEIGAWEHIENMRYQPVKCMQVWDSRSDSMISFNNNDMMDNLAWIVENDIVVEALRRSLASVKDRVEVRYQSSVKNYTLPHEGRESSSENSLVQVHLENGDILNTRLLIGADGFRSLVRQTTQAHSLQWEYENMGVVATLRLSEPTENNVAWQRFLSTGPVALLPLSPEYSCLIWSTVPDEAKELLQLGSDSFVDAVNNAFWSEESKVPIIDYAGQLLDTALGTLGYESRALKQLPPTIVDVDKKTIAAFPLGFLHSSRYVVNRVALIGDAAHRCHPMAGQGVNLGFGDVVSLCDKITKAAKNGTDIGSLQYLSEYETERQRHVVPTILGVDALYRLYRNSWSPVVLARSLGLQATNALNPVKSLFMNHAMR